MSKENDRQSLREYGIRKKRLKRRRIILITLLFFLISAIGIFYMITIYLRNYDSYEILKEIDVTGENAVGYISYGSAVIKYSKDGAVAIDSNGSILWNGSYEMSHPIADTCEEYAVIADRDAKALHIYNQKGEVERISTPYDILKAEIAKQGVVAVLMENEDENHIIFYDTDGTELTDKKSSVSNEGYPLDISLSDDGTKLVTSYLSYKDGKLVDNVAFYNFGEVGKNYSDGIVGGIPYDEGNVIPRVEFVNNDTICLFKDNGFQIFSMAELPKVVHEEIIEHKILSILFDESYVGVVMQAEGSGSKQILIYDLKGNKVLDKSLDYDYETIYLSDKEIVMYDNMSCLILKIGGRTKFKYTFDTNIETILPINNLDRYFLANGKQLLEIQLKE